MRKTVLTAYFIFVFLLISTQSSIAAEILVSNFENNRALTGSFSFAAVRAGQICCPHQIDPNFEEQSAQSFTLTRSAKITGFELVLFQFRGNIDSLNISLTRASDNNPGGNAIAIGRLAPDLDQVIESWHFSNALPSNRILFEIESVLNPTLPAGEMFWLTLTPGQDVVAGEVIDIGWVTGDIPLMPPSIFARRNNPGGGDIDEIVWSTGSGQFLPHQAGFTLRVLGDPIPEPTTLAILGLGLAGLGVMRRRRERMEWPL